MKRPLELCQGDQEQPSPAKVMRIMDDPETVTIESFRCFVLLHIDLRRLIMHTFLEHHRTNVLLASLVCREWHAWCQASPTCREDPLDAAMYKYCWSWRFAVYHASSGHLQVLQWSRLDLDLVGSSIAHYSARCYCENVTRWIIDRLPSSTGSPKGRQDFGKSHVISCAFHGSYTSHDSDWSHLAHSLEKDGILQQCTHVCYLLPLIRGGHLQELKRMLDLIPTDFTFTPCHHESGIDAAISHDQIEMLDLLLEKFPKQQLCPHKQALYVKSLGMAKFLNQKSEWNEHWADYISDYVQATIDQKDDTFLEWCRELAPSRALEFEAFIGIAAVYNGSIEILKTHVSHPRTIARKCFAIALCQNHVEMAKFLLSYLDRRSFTLAKYKKTWNTLSMSTLVSLEMAIFLRDSGRDVFGYGMDKVLTFAANACSNIVLRRMPFEILRWLHENHPESFPTWMTTDYWFFHTFDPERMQWLKTSFPKMVPSMTRFLSNCVRARSEQAYPFYKQLRLGVNRYHWKPNWHCLFVAILFQSVRTIRWLFTEYPNVFKPGEWVEKQPKASSFWPPKEEITPRVVQELLCFGVDVSSLNLSK